MMSLARLFSKRRPTSPRLAHGPGCVTEGSRRAGSDRHSRGEPVRWGPYRRATSCAVVGWVAAALIVGLMIPGMSAGEGSGSGDSSIDEATLLSRYRQIWQAEFQRRNQFSADVFAASVAIDREEIMRTDSGNYYWVVYFVRGGWVAIKAVDQLMVFRKSSAGGHRTLSLPLDTWFSPEQVARAVDARWDASDMTRVSPIGQLAYASLDAAKAEISRKTGISRFITTEPVFYVPGKLPRSDGDPYLLFTGTRGAVPDAPEAAPGPDDLVPARPMGGGIEGRGPATHAPHYCEAPETGGVASEVAGPAAAVAPSSSPSAERKVRPCSAKPPSERAAPRGPGRDQTVTKGWLNLVSGALEHHEDQLIYY